MARCLYANRTHVIEDFDLEGFIRFDGRLYTIDHLGLRSLHSSLGGVERFAKSLETLGIES